MEIVQIFYEYGGRLVPFSPEFRADDCPLEGSLEVNVTKLSKVSAAEAIGEYCWRQCDNQSCPFRGYGVSVD